MEKRRSFLKKCLAIPIILAGSCGSKSADNTPIQTVAFPKTAQQVRKVLVLWFSQTGHTKRNAKLIAHVWQEQGLNVTASDIREFDGKSIGEFDLILLGTPVFYYETPEYVQEWIKKLPTINQIPVAAFVTFGGPEGDQHNAACTILELLSQKGGLPVGLRTFMNMATFPISWSNNSIAKNILDNRNLPDEKTYNAVRSFAESIIEQVNLGYTIPFEKRVTLRRLSTLFDPTWWTKRLIDSHKIDPEKCTDCGICEEKCPADAIFPKTGKIDFEKCVLCFGCLNNCPVQAVVMEYKGRKLFGFYELLKRKHITIKEPQEFVKTAENKNKPYTG